MKGLYFSNFLPISETKSFNWKVFSSIYNNFAEQNFFDKSVFNNVCRINHSSLMNNTAANKINHFPKLIALGPQIVLKRKWHYLLSWSIITTKLDIWVYKYKDDYICRGLFQAICMVTINFWLNFLLKTNHHLHQILMP